MVRYDLPKELLYEHRRDLLIYDYEVAFLIGLDVKNDTGVAPSLSFPHTGFSFGAEGNFNQSRQDTLSINLAYSMRNLASRYAAGDLNAECPVFDTALSGELGIRRSVSAALETLDLKQITEVGPTSGEFAGTITYSNTKAVNSLGPTFSLTHFAGPGGLLSASNVNTDTLSFGFATGKNAAKKFQVENYFPTGPDTGRRAREVLARQVASDFGIQLVAIRNLLR